MSTPLFGSNILPSCQYCEKALRVMAKHNQVLCEKYGVVKADYSCRHFVYDPLWRVPIKPPTLQTFDDDDFDL